MVEPTIIKIIDGVLSPLSIPWDVADVVEVEKTANIVLLSSAKTTIKRTRKEEEQRPPEVVFGSDKVPGIKIRNLYSLQPSLIVQNSNGEVQALYFSRENVLLFFLLETPKESLISLITLFLRVLLHVEKKFLGLSRASSLRVELGQKEEIINQLSKKILDKILEAIKEEADEREGKKEGIFDKINKKFRVKLDITQKMMASKLLDDGFPLLIYVKNGDPTGGIPIPTIFAPGRLLCEDEWVEPEIQDYRRARVHLEAAFVYIPTWNFSICEEEGVDPWSDDAHCEVIPNFFKVKNKYWVDYYPTNHSDKYGEICLGYDYTFPCEEYLLSDNFYDKLHREVERIFLFGHKAWGDFKYLDLRKVCKIVKKREKKKKRKKW